MSLRFVDHQAFHRAAFGMMTGGIAAGAVAGLAGAGVTGALFAGATGAVAGVAWSDLSAERDRSARLRAAARGLLLALGLGAFLLGREVAGGHVGVLALAVVLGLALNLGGSWRRMIAAAVIGGGIAYLGGYACGQVVIARETAPLPDFLEITLASAAMTGVCIAALLPRHLHLLGDAVATAQRRLPAGLDPEVRSLVDRGVAVWRQVSPQLGDEDRALFCEGVLRMLDLAARMARADHGESAELLEQRRIALDARIEASTDEVARAQYLEARAAIGDQIRYSAQIATARERVVARLHACVTTLEKFRLAAARQATLAEVSAEIAACGQALAELEAPAAPPAAA